jgi:hypothetical protein
VSCDGGLLCVCVCVRACAHARMCACVRVCLCLSVRVFSSACACACVRACVWACLYLSVRACACVYACACQVHTTVRTGEGCGEQARCRCGFSAPRVHLQAGASGVQVSDDDAQRQRLRHPLQEGATTRRSSLWMTFCVYACGVWVGVCVGVRLCSRICVWLVCLAALLLRLFCRCCCFRCSHALHRQRCRWHRRCLPPHRCRGRRWIRRLVSRPGASSRPRSAHSRPSSPRGERSLSAV